MDVYRTIDVDAISNILNHPKVFNFITDDRSPDFFTPIVNPQIIYLIDDKKQGVVRIDPMNGIMCSVHIATLPDMWGNAVNFVKECLAWGWQNTTYMKVIAIIPEFNKHTISLATRSGFEREGVLRKSFLKNWKLHDQVVFGLCKKGEITCQW